MCRVERCSQLYTEREHTTLIMNTHDIEYAVLNTAFNCVNYTEHVHMPVSQNFNLAWVSEWKIQAP